MIEITVTAYNMHNDGLVDERDFAAWEMYCGDRLAADLGLSDVKIQAHDFRNGPITDTIVGATDEQKREIRRWLAVDGWEAFCATPDAWPKRD